MLYRKKSSDQGHGNNRSSTAAGEESTFVGVEGTTISLSIHDMTSYFLFPGNGFDEALNEMLGGGGELP